MNLGFTQVLVTLNGGYLLQAQDKRKSWYTCCTLYQTLPLIFGDFTARKFEYQLKARECGNPLAHCFRFKWKAENPQDLAGLFLAATVLWTGSVTDFAVLQSTVSG
jgi:hypothetical protein